MPHYGTLRDYNFLDSEKEDPTSDIRGASIYGSDGKKLGKIDDVIFDHTSGNIHYVVIDAGGWLSTKKFIVPPQQLRPSSEPDHDFTVNMTNEQIEKLPAYDDAAVSSQEGWRDYENRYQESWVSGAVQHPADRIIRNATDLARPRQFSQRCFQSKLQELGGAQRHRVTIDAVGQGNCAVVHSIS